MALPLAMAVLALALWSVAAAAQTVPPLSGRVVDAADIIPPDREAALAAELAAHERRTGEQVVVVTLPSLEGYAIEEYGVRLGRAWEIGTAEDDGVLLIVAPAERRVRIEVGYGLEATLTDAGASAIINNTVLPAFRSGDLAGGIAAGAAAILAVLSADAAGSAIAAPPPVAAPAGDGWAEEDWAEVIFTLVVVAVIVAQVWGGGGGTVRGRGPGGPIVFYPGRRSGSPGGFRGGGGFRGRGGSFGGGGASGSW